MRSPTFGAKLARRVRLLSTGHGRKSDNADALSIGIAAWTAPALPAVQIDEAIAALRAAGEHRDDMAGTRTQLINRLHALLVKLAGSGLPRGLTVEAASDALRRIRPRDPLARTLRTIAAELVALLRRLDRRIDDAAHTLSAAVTASQTTLTELLGIGDVVAAKILARTGPISRFPTSAAFASYCGVAPIEVSSGDVVRHRLSASRRPAVELRPPRHGAIPDPIRIPRPRLLPAQARRRQKPQRGDAMPETASHMMAAA